jgi:hypothetical protein
MTMIQQYHAAKQTQPIRFRTPPSNETPLNGEVNRMQQQLVVRGSLR